MAANDENRQYHQVNSGPGMENLANSGAPRKKKPGDEDDHYDAEETGLTGFMNLINKAAFLLLLNIFWLITCVPIITIGPATIALYTTIRKAIIDDEGYPFSTYWKQLKSNFKSGVKVWIPMALALGLMGYDIYYLNGVAKTGNGSALGFILLLIPFTLAVLTLYYSFGYMSHFQDTTWRCIRNSFLIMLMHPGRNFVAVIMTIIMVALIAFVPWCILILPATFLMMFAIRLEKVFQAMIEAEEAKQQGNT